MPEITRTLVKSAPELWAELSDPDALGRHLEAFGTVTITDAQTEQRLAWEAERATGSLSLEPSGFGTRVTATFEPRLAEPAPAPETEPLPEPDAEADPEPEPRRGFFARLLRRKPQVAEVPPQPEPPPPPPPPEPEPLIAPAEAEAALAAMLDALGTARHRPFSRA